MKNPYTNSGGSGRWRDRHSKIRTARGLRDRRMRLSLDVAPDFFDIQDMLGHDRASKTLRWLITASGPAIQQLIAASSPPHRIARIDNAASSSSAPKPLRTAALARESRVKARARARERTAKKCLLTRAYENGPSSSDQVPNFSGRLDEFGLSVCDYDESFDVFHDQWEMERILGADVLFQNWDL